MQPLLGSEHTWHQFDLQGLLRLSSLTRVTVRSQCSRILFLHTPLQPLTPSYHQWHWDGQVQSLTALLHHCFGDPSFIVGWPFQKSCTQCWPFTWIKSGPEKKNTDVLFRPIRRAIDLEFCFVVRQAHLSAALWVLELVREIRNCMLWSSGSWWRGGKNQNLASSSPSGVDISKKNTSQNKLHPLLIHRTTLWYTALQKPTAFLPFELSIVVHSSALTLLPEKFGTVPQSNLHLLLAMTTESHCFAEPFREK